jgi:hypothetical protein
MNLNPSNKLLTQRITSILLHWLDICRCKKASAVIKLLSGSMLTSGLALIVKNRYRIENAPAHLCCKNLKAL